LILGQCRGRECPPGVGRFGGEGKNRQGRGMEKELLVGAIRFFQNCKNILGEQLRKGGHSERLSQCLKSAGERLEERKKAIHQPVSIRGTNTKRGNVGEKKFLGPSAII